MDEKGNTILHLASPHPNLSVITKIISVYPSLAMTLNDLLQVPLDLLPQNYLTSRKSTLGAQRREAASHFKPIGRPSSPASPLAYATGFTATKAGLFKQQQLISRRKTFESLISNADQVSDRQQESLYNLLMHDLGDNLQARYSRFNNSVIRKSAAGEIEDFHSVNRLLFFEELKHRLQQKGKSHVSHRYKASAKRFMSELNSPSSVSVMDQGLASKLDFLISSKHVSHSVLLIFLCLKLVRGLQDSKIKQQYLSKLAATFQDLEERPVSDCQELLSSKFILASIFTRLDELF